MFNLIVRRLDLLGLLIILMIAASLRLGYLGVAEYRQDEAQLTALVLDITQGKPIPLLGIPASIGLPNSPMTVYLLLPPFLISPSPLAAIAYIALLNCVGVGLLWLIAYRYLGRAVAFVAGLAYAVNPWAVMYSRKIWAQDYHTPFILLAIFLALHGFIEKKRWAQVLSLPIFLIGLQIHFAAWSLLPIYFWLLGHGRKNTTARLLAISGLLSIAVMLPYLMGILQSLGQFSTTPPDGWTVQRILEPAQHIIHLTTGLQLEGTFARDQAADFLAQIPQPALLWTLAALFALIGVIVLLRGKWPRYLVIMMLLWGLITVTATTLGAILGQFSSFWIASYTHYYIPTIPVFCLFGALGVTAIAAWRPPMKALSIATGAVAAAIFVTPFLAVIGMLRYVDTHLTTSGFGFGIPIHYLLTMRDVLRPYRDIIIVNGDGRDLPSTGAPIWHSLLPETDRCIRDLTLIDSAVVFPSHPLVAVFGPRQSDVDISSLKAVYQQATPTIVNLMPAAEPFQVYPLQDNHWTGSPITDSRPTRFTNGLTLTGYTVEANKLSLMWVLPSQSPIFYATVINYLSADNSVLGQQKEPFWQSDNWCMDDTLVDWISIAPPTGTTQLEIGLETASKDHPPIATDTGETGVHIPFNTAPKTGAP